MKILFLIIVFLSLIHLNAQTWKFQNYTLGDTIIIRLHDYIGDIQWQYSDEHEIWIDITNAKSDTLLITDYNTYYRAKVTVTNYTPFYSDHVIINPYDTSSVTDIDGNVYKTIKLGNQWWMSENLRTTHYADGTSLVDGTDFDHYSEEACFDESDTTKYYFFYNNNSNYAERYGALYNWFSAVNGTVGSETNPSRIQGVAPDGWHIPSINEWTELLFHLGVNPDSVAYYTGTNQSTLLIKGGSTEFNAEYGGARHDLGNEFFALGNMGAYISSDNEGQGWIILIEFHRDIEKVIYHGHRKTTGYSVRCVKDINDSPNDWSDYTGRTIYLDVNIDQPDVTDAEFDYSHIPNRLVLYQNYPNPFNPSTVISYQLSVNSKVELSVYNTIGQKVAILVNGRQNAGEYQVQWQADGLPSGIYLARLHSGTQIETLKLILQK